MEISTFLAIVCFVGVVGFIFVLLFEYCTPVFARTLFAARIRGDMLQAKREFQEELLAYKKELKVYEGEEGARLIIKNILDDEVANFVSATKSEMSKRVSQLELEREIVNENMVKLIDEKVIDEIVARIVRKQLP